MPPNLDVSALRSLIAIADCGGYHRAAEVLGVSQSTVSQHVRKMEKTLGQSLLEPDGRGRRFTPNGESLLESARTMVATHDDIVERFSSNATTTFVVGATEHGAEHLLPFINQAFAAELPQSSVRFRLDRSSRLDTGLDRGSVDVALMLGSTSAGVDTAGTLPLAWYAAHDWQEPPPNEPLPIVVIDSPCTIRRKAIDTLTSAGRDHRVVAEAGYLAGVINATRAGVGVAMLANPGQTPQGLVRRTDLPSADPEPLQIRVSDAAPSQLADIVKSAVRAALDS